MTATTVEDLSKQISSELGKKVTTADIKRAMGVNIYVGNDIPLTHRMVMQVHKELEKSNQNQEKVLISLPIFGFVLLYKKVKIQKKYFKIQFLKYWKLYTNWVEKHFSTILAVILIVLSILLVIIAIIIASL